jgi:cysteine desulfuration protein SufE
METIIDREEDIIEEFSFFDDWMDKYTHLISLGKELEQMIPENKTSENQIKGCQVKCG